MNYSCIASLVVLSFAVAGCGEGSGSVASAPVPITSAASATVVSRTTVIGAELPPTPATIQGNYGAIAARNLAAPANGYQLSANNSAPGDLNIAVGADGRSYTLSFNTTSIPFPAAGIADYSIADPKFGKEYTTTTRFSDGTSVADQLKGLAGIVDRPIEQDNSLATSSTFWIVKGQSHVSLGRWSWWQTPAPGGAGKLLGDLYFVFGDRTPTAAIPTSGTATYVTDNTRGDFLEWRAIAYDLGDFSIKLTADFAKRSMDANVSIDYLDPKGQEIVSKLAGTGQIVPDGSLGVPLTGVYNSKDPQSDPMSGSIAGALFGPAAEQVGATLTLLHGTDDPIVAAFTGVRP